LEKKKKKKIIYFKKRIKTLILGDKEAKYNDICGFSKIYENNETNL